MLAWIKKACDFIKGKFSLIVSIFISLLFAIIGIQKRTLEKRKEELKKVKDELDESHEIIKLKEKQIEIIGKVDDIQENSLQEQKAIEKKIEEAVEKNKTSSQEEIIDMSNQWIDEWNEKK